MSSSRSEFHPTAIISSDAVIGEGTTIGPYSIIGPHVRLGRNNKIASHVVIEGFTEIGDDNEFFQFASIGSRPQDLKFKGEESRLVVGNRNTVREYVTMQPGTAGGGMISRVGDSNLFMVSSHLGHDGIVGNGNVIANCCALAGHVIVGNHTILGGLSAVHQFCRVGDYAMLAGGAMLVNDLIPCGIAQGDRAALSGVNTIGLERAGHAEDAILGVKNLYKDLFLKKGVFAEKLAGAKDRYKDLSLATSIVEFIETSQRGIIIPRSKRGS